MFDTVARSGAAQRRSALTEELDELTHHVRSPQELGDSKDKVGRGHARPERPAQLDAHHVGDEKVNRFTQHGRLCLDPADSPAYDADTVHHGACGSPCR